MVSVCIGSFSWCYFVVTLFRCSLHVSLFRGIPIVLPVYGYMFHQCSGVPPMVRVPSFRVPVFLVFWFYSMSCKRCPLKIAASEF